MNRAKLARLLAKASAREQEALLARYPALPDVALARALKDLYLEINASDPACSRGWGAPVRSRQRAPDPAPRRGP